MLIFHLLLSYLWDQKALSKVVPFNISLTDLLKKTDIEKYILDSTVANGGAGEITQQLSSAYCSSKNPNSQHQHDSSQLFIKSSSRGSDALFLTAWAPGTQMLHGHIYPSKTLTHTYKIKLVRFMYFHSMCIFCLHACLLLLVCLGPS